MPEAASGDPGGGPFRRSRKAASRAARCLKLTFPVDLSPGFRFESSNSGCQIGESGRFSAFWIRHPRVRSSAAFSRRSAANLVRQDFRCTASQRLNGAHWPVFQRFRRATSRPPSTAPDRPRPAFSRDSPNPESGYKLTHIWHLAYKIRMDQ